MWHTTDQTPREGAKVVACDLDLEWLAAGEYRDGNVRNSDAATPLNYFQRWAYAPGEVE